MRVTGFARVPCKRTIAKYKKLGLPLPDALNPATPLNKLGRKRRDETKAEEPAELKRRGRKRQEQQIASSLNHGVPPTTVGTVRVKPADAVAKARQWKRPYIDIAKNYAKRAADPKHKDTFGRWIRLAAQRFLHDLDRARQPNA